MRWTKNEMEPPPSWLPNIKTRNLLEYQEIQILLLHQLAKQIKILYPKSKLHVITNEKHEDHDNIIYHKFNFESNHLGKLYMYGLLSEPCMYLDADIIIINPFMEEELQWDQPFYFFQSFSGGDIQSNTKCPLPIEINYIHNAGMVWIPNPSMDVTNELFNIHEKYFYDKTATDEHCCSLFYKLKNMQINKNPKINVPRLSLEKEDVVFQQTVHYTGYDIKWKKLCLQEFYQFFIAKNLRLQ